MSRHRTATRLPGRKARLLAAPAFGALGVTFLAVLVPPSALAADKDCGDFASQADAQAHFTSSGGSTVNNVDNLDANHNGIACETFTYATQGDDGVIDDRCTNQIDYATDPRDNATINSIGEQTGECPDPLGGSDPNIDPVDVPQGGVAAGDGDASGLFRLF